MEYYKSLTLSQANAQTKQPKPAYAKSIALSGRNIIILVFDEGYLKKPIEKEISGALQIWNKRLTFK